jgi:magnesium chelatase subunit I
MEITEQLRKVFLSKESPLGDIIGQEQAKQQIKSALIMGRHIVILGPPGIGKTTMAKSIAKLLPSIKVNDCGYNCLPDNPVCPSCRQKKEKQKTIELSGESRFIRVQGSPDLTAEDIIGDIDPVKAMKFGPLSPEAFTPGKILKANNGILFFDELNRCPEKLQNALLEVLEEGKATVGSYDVDFEASFLFIGTMNPSDSNTEKLSDVLLDRFDIIYMHYPETDDIERQIVLAKGTKVAEMPASLLTIIIKFVRLLREDSKLEKVPSVRATLGLYERAQANALLAGRKKVEFSDIKSAIISVIAHRIRLKPSVKYLKEPQEYIAKEFEEFINATYPEIASAPDFGSMPDNESGGSR